MRTRSSRFSKNSARAGARRESRREGRVGRRRVDAGPGVNEATVAAYDCGSATEADRKFRPIETMVAHTGDLEEPVAVHSMTTSAEGCNEQKPLAMAVEIVKRALKGRTTLGRVLDVGCGIGSILIAARPNARSLTGVDIRQVFLDEAVGALPDATLVLESAEALPFANASFDTIFFCDVIEHMENPFVVLREIRRVLAPGGVLLVTTPNSNAVMHYILRANWPARRDVSHILYFTRFSLRHALASVGFERIGDETLGGSNVRLANALLEFFRNGGTLVSTSRGRS